jgi:exosortase
LYYLYLNRDSLQAIKARTSWWGLIWLVLGVLLFGYGIWPGQNDFVKDFGMVVTLFGVVLLLAGGEVMKIAWFPIAFLVCAIPWPGLLYSQIAGPLQSMAAHVAVWVMQAAQVKAFIGLPGGWRATKIMYSVPVYGQPDSTRTLNVAEACAGLRSLMTFISIGAALAFLLWSFRPLWQKLIITASAVPIAIFCNVMRVSGQGLLDRYVSRELSESFAHQFVGLIMMIPAFFLLLAMGWILDRLLLEEVDEAKVISRGVVRRSRAARMAPPPPVRLLAPRASGRTTPANAKGAPAPVNGDGFTQLAGNVTATDQTRVGTSAPITAAQTPGIESTEPPRITPPPARTTRMPPRTPLAPGRASSRPPSTPRNPRAMVPPPPMRLPQRPDSDAPKPTGTEDAP